MANPPADACPPSRAASGAGLQQGTERTPVPRSTRQPPKNHSEEQKARCLPSAARSWCSQHRSPVLGWELGRRRDPFFFFFFPAFRPPREARTVRAAAASPSPALLAPRGEGAKSEKASPTGMESLETERGCAQHPAGLDLPGQSGGERGG